MHRRRTTFQHVTLRSQRNGRRGGTVGAQSNSQNSAAVVRSACLLGSTAGNDHLLGLESCPLRSVSTIPADAIHTGRHRGYSTATRRKTKANKRAVVGAPVHRASKCDNSPCTLLFATASALLCSCCEPCCIFLLLCPCRLGSHPPEGRQTLATALLRESTRGPQSCVSRAVGSLACHAPRL